MSDDDDDETGFETRPELRRVEPAPREHYDASGLSFLVRRRFWARITLVAILAIIFLAIFFVILTLLEVNLWAVIALVAILAVIFVVIFLALLALLGVSPR